jgi:cytochrome c553
MTWPRILIGGAALVLIAVLGGAIPVGASSGHWAVTAWVLDLVKRRSVAVRSLGVETPPLDRPGLVRVGANHYEVACRGCHGSPSTRMPIVPSRMTPHPPNLAHQVARWQPRELFYLVRHGIKFTGMPAWPSAERPDEIWSVVAFVRRLPAMDAGSYQAYRGSPPATIDAADIASVAAVRCAPCHAMEAADREETRVPLLDGQHESYLDAALRAYADGSRHSGIMAAVASSLDEHTRRDLARFYAARPATGRTSHAGAGAATGAIIKAGDPERDIPACVECHEESGSDRHPDYPLLAGQPATYLRLQLELLAANTRGGGPHREVMREIAVRLSADQRGEAARAFAALGRPGQ